MRKSIKIMAGVRVVAALLAVMVFSVMTTKNIYNMEDSAAANVAVNEVLQRAQKAEAAHYKWSSNLSNALYAGMEFTGSTDPTGCVLGQWLYGEAGTEDKAILDLRTQALARAIDGMTGDKPMDYSRFVQENIDCHFAPEDEGKIPIRRALYLAGGWDDGKAACVYHYLLALPFTMI